MPRTVVPLTDTKIKQAKPKEKPYKITDGQGLFLLVTPSGTKSWRFKYRINNKEKIITFGKYPEITLKRARMMRLENRTLVANGKDPKLIKPIVKKTHLLKSIIAQWLKHIEGESTPNHQKAIKQKLENYIIPSLGNRAIDNIKQIDIANLLQDIQKQGVIDTSHRIYGYLNRIWKFAVTLQKTDQNIILDIDKRSILKTKPKKHYPAITNPREVGKLLDAIEHYQGYNITRLALKLMPHVFLRPANIRFAEWSEFNLNKKVWIIPPEKMKMKRKHIVPLSEQVITIIKEIKFLNKNSKYLFPSPHSTLRPLSENTLNTSLRRMGYTKDEIVSHSFRHTASTLLHENMSKHGFSSDIIERQLAHAERNGVKEAYNSAEHLKERIKLMQWWSNYLESLQKATIPPLVVKEGINKGQQLFNEAS